jgi:hypothetical protein
MTKYISALRYGSALSGLEICYYSYILSIKHGAAASRVALVSKFEPQHVPA